MRTARTSKTTKILFAVIGVATIMIVAFLVILANSESESDAAPSTTRVPTLASLDAMSDECRVGYTPIEALLEEHPDGPASVSSEQAAEIRSAVEAAYLVCTPEEMVYIEYGVIAGWLDGRGVPSTQEN